MNFSRRSFIKRTSGVGSVLSVTKDVFAEPASTTSTMRSTQSGRRKVIYDQDNSGPFSTDILGLLMLLQADNIDLLGITLVTGDAWLKQEMAYTLRLLELMGRTEVPVYAGAEYPMLNTKEEALLRYKLYGGHRLDPWLGAFNSNNGGPNDVKPLAASYGGFAKIKPQSEHAARFIIKTVRANPGQVTLYAGGPLTNLALAIKLDPDIVPLVPEVVFMGTGLQKFTSAFNIFFDAEAGEIVLRAPWPKFTVVTVDLAEEIHLGDKLKSGRMMIEEVSERGASPIKDLFREHALKPYQQNPKMSWFRMPDEMMAAQIIEPSIFPSAKDMYVDIDTDIGATYGASMFWDKNWQDVWRTRGTEPQWSAGPPPTAQTVNVLSAVNPDRFKDLFVELMTKPIRKP